MKILITNDDGLNAAGLYHLWLGLKDLHDITIVAPHQERSGSSTSITLYHSLNLQPAPHACKKAWQLNGTPADCVSVALSADFGLVPDLVISGINRGSNAGRNALYSGTIGATIEAAHRGIPALAISCAGHTECQYKKAQDFIACAVEWIAQHPLPKGCVLNITVPIHPQILGVKITHQGRSYWRNEPKNSLPGASQGQYQMVGYYHRLPESEYSDIYWLDRGFITMVPLYTEDLTHHEWAKNHQNHSVGINLSKT